MTGRPPRPTARQIVEGDPRRHGTHKLEQRLAAEPVATDGLPRCPSHLKGRARKAWKLWVQELEAMDMDRRPDGQLLEGACIAYRTVIEADEMIQKQGSVIAKKALDPVTNTLVVVDVKPHPAVAQRDRALLILRGFCAEFGFSPASRTRLAVERPDSGDADLLEILSQPRSSKQPHPEAIQ